MLIVSLYGRTRRALPPPKKGKGLLTRRVRRMQGRKEILKVM